MGYETNVSWPGSDQSATNSAEIYLRAIAVHPGFFLEGGTAMPKLYSVGLCRSSSANSKYTFFTFDNFCPLTKFDCGLLRLREADEAAVVWLTTYGS